METKFLPDYAIHPGIFLKEEMKDLNISQKKLSEEIGVSTTIINEIIQGKRRINAEIAVKIETRLFSPASYWLNLQSNYDEAQARIKLNTNGCMYSKNFKNIEKKHTNVYYEVCLNDTDCEAA